MTKAIKLFIEKNKFLNSNFSEVSYKNFYRDIFPKGSFEKQGNFTENKGNGIAVEINNSKSNNVLITDDLKEINKLVNSDFVITSPMSYFGNRRTNNMATLLYGFAFDIDGLDMKNIKELRHQTITTELNPHPTYIVNSGHGVHLYYIFKEPIKMYNHIKEPLNKLKFALTDRLWNINTSNIDEKQFQGIFQGFRMVGSPTKFGKDYRLKAFKTGEKIDIDYLNSFVPDDKQVESLDYQSDFTLKQAKEKYPEWYQKVKVEKNTTVKKWNIKRDLYDWWHEKIKEEAVFGHRYFSVMVLAIYAKKCNISYDELKKDAYNLIPIMSAKMVTEPFTSDDVESALKSYNESYITFPREDIEKLTAISIPTNKRNGRKQEIHLQIARSTKEGMKAVGEMKPEGRPKGSGTKENEVKEYINNNPDDTPTEIARELEISRTTVYKHMKN